MKPLQIEGARALAEAGAINHVRVVAVARGLSVEINKTFVVANRLREPRFFAKADTCFSWLREMGINQIHEVDLNSWGAADQNVSPASAGIISIWKFGVATMIGSEWARLTEKAKQLSEKGRYTEALAFAEKGLQAAEESLPPSDFDIARLLNCVAVIHHALQQFDLAIPLYRRARENAEKVLNADDIMIATLLNNLAEAYDATGQSGETEQMYTRALKIVENHSTMGKDELAAKQMAMATIQTNLASLHLQHGKYKDAEPLFLRALKISGEKAGWFGTGHPEEQRIRSGLAELYRKTGREADAHKFTAPTAARATHLLR